MFGCSHCATSWVNQHGWQFPMEMVNPRHAELLPFCFTIHRRFTCYRFVSPFTLWRVYCGIVSFRFVLTFKIVKHSIQLIWRVCETGGSTCTCTTRTYRLPNLIFFGKAVVVLRRVLLYQHGHFKCIYIYMWQYMDSLYYSYHCWWPLIQPYNSNKSSQGSPMKNRELNKANIK